MLRMPYPLEDAEADEIVKKFVNDRLISLMEDVIIEFLPDTEDFCSEKDEETGSKPFEELVNISKLMTNQDFAEDIAFTFLPEGYSLKKASQEFFGLYRLLKAKKDYVPELSMEYILFHVIFREIDDIDTINEYMEDGVFDDLEDGLLFGGGEDEEYTTVIRIPEPNRTIVKNAIMKRNEGQYTPEELEDLAEFALNQYEDLREYEESCFWDTDFLFLDEMTEDELLGSELNKLMGIGTPKEPKVIEFPVKGQNGKSTTVKAEMNIYPWDLEDD